MIYRLLVLLFLAQAIPFPGPGGVGAGSGSNINTTPTAHNVAHSNVVTLTAITGHLVTVEIGNDGLGGTTSACADGTNTYTHVPLAPAANTGLPAIGADMWYAKNVTGGSLTITCTESMANTVFVYAQDWSGASTTAPFDTSAISNTGSTVGPITTALGSELILIISSNAGSSTPCTGYTSVDIGNSNVSSVVGKLAAGSAGSYTASGCQSSFPANVMAAFK